MARKVSRRGALRLAGATVPLTLAGCMADAGSEPSPPSAAPTPSPEPFDPLDHVAEWHPEPARARGAPIEAEVALDTFEPLDTACTSLATDAVRASLDQRLDDPGRLSGGSGAIEHPDFERADSVNRQFIVNRDGTVADGPVVSYDALLEATPRTVRATVTFEDQTCRCEYPVFLEDEVAYEE